MYFLEFKCLAAYSKFQGGVLIGRRALTLMGGGGGGRGGAYENNRNRFSSYPKSSRKEGKHLFMRGTCLIFCSKVWTLIWGRAIISMWALI